MKIASIVRISPPGGRGLLHDPAPAWSLVLLTLCALAAVQHGVLAHDAGHHAVDRRRWVNGLVGQVGMTLVNGLSFRHWCDQHDRHHRHCQDEDRDPDMQYDSLLSLYPRAAHAKRGLARRMAPWQALYFWQTAVLFYALALRWESLRSAVKRPDRFVVDRWLLPVHCLPWLGLPSIFLGVWTAFIHYVVVSVLIGAALLTLFAVNHMGMPSVGPGMRWGPIRQQVETSRDVPVQVDAT